MNTNFHEWMMEPRNTRNHTEGLNGLFQCLPCFPWLKNNSVLSTHNSELAAGVMAEKLKEIQR